jgi:hypothetical protein
MKGLLSAAWVLTCTLSFTAASGEKAAEFDLDEFNKAYTSPKPEMRIAAVDMLKGLRHPGVFIALSRVAEKDEDKNLRLKAFGMMVEWPDTDGRLVESLVPIYRLEKDAETKVAMSEYLPRLPVKTLALDALIELVKSKRRAYPRALAILNEMTGKNFEQSRDTFLEVEKWWELNRGDYQKADAIALRKLQRKTAP